MVERKIKKTDVLLALKNGIVIEIKENSKPCTHCLILGHTSKGKPLHVAVALVPDGVLILTTYEPYAKIWGENFDKKVVK